MSKHMPAVMAAVLAVMLLSVMPVLAGADDSSAADDITTADFYDALEVKAGSSASFEVYVTNSNPYTDHDSANDRIVEMRAVVSDTEGNSIPDVTATASLKDGSGNRIILAGQETAVYIVTISAGAYVERGDCNLSYTVTSCKVDKTEIEVDPSMVYTVGIISDNSSSVSYNKFFGILANDFDGFLGSVVFTAIATFLGAFAIGAVISLILAPVICMIMARKGSPERKALRKPLFRLFLAAFAVNAVSLTVSVIGLSNADMIQLSNLFNVIYVLIIAFIIWKVYGALLDRIAESIKSRGAGDALDNFMSFRPLFMYLGEIIIAIFGVFTVMSMFGFDMAAIITSAGLITLGITFGAQQILSQFFAGLLLLTTRPFKKGDLIQLGSDDVYRVRKVNVMNTELENWDNSDITIVPNNTLTSSQIKNLTRDTLRTKAHIFVGVGYGSDLDVARKLMMESAQEHANVLKDGGMAPSTRIIDFQDSNILLRLTVWVEDFNIAGGVGGDLRDAMFKKFNAAGIPIDYPQVVLHSADKADN